MHLTLAFNKNMCYNTTTIKSALGTAPLIARQPAFARCQRLNDGKNRFTAHRTMGFFTASLWNTLGGFFYETNHSQSRKSTATCQSSGHFTFKEVQKRTTAQQKVLFSCCGGGLGQKTVFRDKHNMYGCVGVAGKNVRHYGGAITCTAIFPRHIVRQSRDAGFVGVEVYVSLSQLCSDLCR